MIKHTFLTLVIFPLLFIFHTAIAHPVDSIPPYKQFPFIPSFQLIAADSSKFYMKDVVPKKKAAVVVIFSPTCSHCQQQVQEITSHIQSLATVQFLLATGYPLPQMQQFVSDYGLAKFSNIQVGQDRGMNLGSFYKISALPGIFVYNKKGKLVAEFASHASAEAIAEAIKKD